MKKTLDRFFMSDRLLYAMPWIFTAAVIIYQIIANIASGDSGSDSIFYPFDLMLDIMLIFFTFGIAVSYKAHEKNIMKMLFGAVLSERVIYAAYWVSNSFVDGESKTVDIVLAVVFLCLYILFFVNHLALGYGHKANPERLNLNRIVALFIIVADIIWDMWDLDSIQMFVVYALDIIYEAAILIEMLCIETKVDAYKVIRENKEKRF